MHARTEDQRPHDIPAGRDGDDTAAGFGTPIDVGLQPRRRVMYLPHDLG